MYVNLLRPSFEEVKEGRILHLVSGNKRFINYREYDINKLVVNLLNKSVNLVNKF
jgi:hypothetical protein